MPLPKGASLIEEPRSGLPEGATLLEAAPSKPNPTLPQWIKHKLEADKAHRVYSTYGDSFMSGQMEADEALTLGVGERDKILKTAGEFDDSSLGPLKYIAGETAQLLPYMISSQVEGLRNGLIIGGGFAAMAAGLGQAGPQAAVPEEILTVPGAFAGGMATGYYYGVIKHTLGREGGGIALDLLAKGIDPKKARIAGLAGGTAIGIIEAYQFKVLSKPFKQALAKTANSKIGRNAIAKVVGRYMKTWGTEVAQEDLQEIVSLTVETIAGLADGKEIPTKGEWADRLIETTKRSAAGMGVIALPGAAVDVTTIKKEKAIEPGVEAPVEEKVTEGISPVEPKAEEITPEKPSKFTATIQKIVTQSPKKPEVINEKIQTRVKEIKETKEKASFLKETLGYFKDIGKAFSHRLNVTKTPEYAEQFKELPNTYKTREGGVAADELLDEINAEEIGVKFDSVDEMLNYMRELPSVMEDLQNQLAETKDIVVKKKEASVLAQRMRDIKQGFRKGIVYTKKEIKDVQSQMVNVIQASDMVAQDKAKFIATIKNIQTQEQLQKRLPDIEVRIRNLVAAQEVRVATKQIKKELKTTKPIKQGAVRKGKYDYETNKQFETLRADQKLNKAQAYTKLSEIGEATDEFGLMERRFLSLKADGANASTQLVNQVLDDIKMLKEIGKGVKDQQEFEAKLNRQQEVDKVVASMGKIGRGAKKASTKIVNAYRAGLGNIYSVLNSIVGKELAEKYDPQRAENARQTAILNKTESVQAETAKILDIAPNKVIDTLYDMANTKYELVDTKGLRTEINKLDIIDIYNSIKNEQKRQQYFDAYGEEQIRTLTGPLTLTSEEMALGDYWQEVVQEYYPVLNEKNIREKGVDLGRVSEYWPATSRKPLNIFDDIRLQGETLSAQKERAKGKVKPIPKNAWLKMQKHIAQGEHAANLSLKYETLKRLFNDETVENQIKEKFGDNIFNLLNRQIDNISLNKQTQQLDEISKVIGKALNNWVTAKIALSPSVFVKQLISVGNYMEVMPVKPWIKYFAQGIAHPRKTFDFMWKNAPFLEARYKRGYTEAINRAIDAASKMGKLKRNWARAMTSLARGGDITAIVFGGYPVVMHELAKHGKIDKAIAKFETATLQAQQSGLASSLSEFQNSRNPMVRLFLAFKNTPNQYFRKQADAIISYVNKDISKKQLAKTLTIYGLIQPALYGTSTVVMSSLLYGSVADEEEGMKRIFEALLMNPFNAIPAIDRVASFVIRELLGTKSYKVFSMPLFDDIETGLRELTKDDITFFDVLESIGATVIEPMTGAPVNLYRKILKKLLGMGGSKAKLR